MLPQQVLRVSANGETFKAATFPFTGPLKKQIRNGFLLYLPNSYFTADLIVSWLSRTSSLFSVNTNSSLREFTHPPDPIMSWIYRSSSLLSLHTTPLRITNRDTKQLPLVELPTGSESVTKQPGIDGNVMTSKDKRYLAARRLVWLIFALLVLLSAVIVRVTVSLPVNEPLSFTAGNMTSPPKNLTST